MDQKTAFTAWTDKPQLFGLDPQGPRDQVDGFGQPVELEWDDAEEVFWVSFETENAFRKHQR